ncbi:MAG: hypothetical protein MMC33_003955 [Icmadophila ericetorum]|nr:hypothetical protein [Icmadophila ericetorum]
MLASLTFLLISYFILLVAASPVPYTYTPHDLGLPTTASTPWDENVLKEIERMRFSGWTEVTKSPFPSPSSSSSSSSISPKDIRIAIFFKNAPCERLRRKLTERTGIRQEEIHRAFPDPMPISLTEIDDVVASAAAIPLSHPVYAAAGQQSPLTNFRHKLLHVLALGLVSGHGSDEGGSGCGDELMAGGGGGEGGGEVEERKAELEDAGIWVRGQMGSLHASGGWRREKCEKGRREEGKKKDDGAVNGEFFLSRNDEDAMNRLRRSAWDGFSGV